MIRIGIVSDRRHVFSGMDQQWECESFTISPTTLSFRQLFHSAFATPARYVQEIYLRLCTIGKGQPESVFVFNPLYQIGRLEIWLALTQFGREPSFSGITIVSDRDGNPVGYGLPASFADDDIPYLALLSTVDAELDAALCMKLFATEVRHFVVTSFTVARAQHNGFIFDENLHIYRWIAANALATLGSAGVVRRKTIPFAAIMPHHAGDVLFFTLAWKLAQPLVDKVVVNQAYRAIVEDNAAELTVIPLEVPLINRSPEFRQGKVTSEGEYFSIIASDLPKDYFYLYLRPSRDYNVSRFHLIDHFAFALGRHLWEQNDLLAHCRPLPAPMRPHDMPDHPVRVLLFFDGGWTLKIYPYQAQQRLIDLLHRRGYSITVLAGGSHNYKNCMVTKFETYQQLKALLLTQHFMVGMDSFPTHLAAHVLGLPTLCLFGSTRPENSNASVAPHYRYLENGLKCRPCYGIVKCPMYGGNECVNFVSPETVVQTLEQMLQSLKIAPSQPVTSVERFVESRPSPDSDQRSPRHIDLDYQAIKTPLYALLVMLTPSFDFTRQVHAEFMTSLRRDGWRQTYLRILRYLCRTLKHRIGS